MRVLRPSLLALLVAACSAPGVSTSTATAPLPALEDRAGAYAVSADRAIAGTVFDAIGSDEIAATLVDLCRGLGGGAVPAVIDGFNGTAPIGDVAIMEEVLTVGIAQVCPERAGADLVRIYLDAVAGAALSAGAGSTYGEAAAVRAAPEVCAALDSGEGVASALVAAAGSLFGVSVDDLGDLDVVLDADQGVVVGAVLASATALLCPEHVGAVTTFLEGL